MSTKIKLTLYVLIVIAVVGATIFTVWTPIVKSQWESDLDIQLWYLDKIIERSNEIEKKIETMNVAKIKAEDLAIEVMDINVELEQIIEDLHYDHSMMQESEQITLKNIDRIRQQLWMTGEFNHPWLN